MVRDIITCRADAESARDRAIVAETQDAHGPEEIVSARASCYMGLDLMGRTSGIITLCINLPLRNDPRLGGVNSRN